jgi:1,4-alpha-glucan branching enzyme
VPGDYPNPANGYVNNGSSGFAPRMSEENVRSMFISSAVGFAVEFHIDGFRLDLTSALHASSTLNMQGAPSAGAANLAGQKFLREFNMTLDLIKPGLVIVA